MRLHTIVQLAGKSTSRHPHIIYILSCLMYWPTLQWSQTVSIDESGLEPQPDRWLSVHGRSIVASWPATTNWFDQLLIWDVALAPNQCMKFGTKNMLFESVFGRGKHCCCLLSWPWWSALIEGIDVSLLLTERMRRGFQIREQKSHVMPVRTRAEGVCRSLKNICTVNARMGSTWVMFQTI